MENGIDEMDVISMFTLEDLKEIGIAKLGHRKKIVTYAKDLRFHKRNDSQCYTYYLND